MNYYILEMNKKWTLYYHFYTYKTTTTYKNTSIIILKKDLVHLELHYHI